MAMMLEELIRRFKKGFSEGRWIGFLRKGNRILSDFLILIKRKIMEASLIGRLRESKILQKLKIHKLSRAILIPALAAIFIAILWFSTVHPRLFQSNVKRTVMLYIRSKANYQEVLDSLKTKDVFRNFNSFDWLARQKKYPASLKPGAYKIEKGWNNKEVLKVLQYGIQTPVKVTFNNIRTRENLAGRLAKCLEADSATFLAGLNNDSLARSMGYTHEGFPGLFIPNTYQFYWNTSPKKFIERMKRESDLFWNETRKTKAKNLGLSIPQVITLASIVQEETNMNDEKSRIAGVYLNRLRRDWFLQADPTVKFAVGDFTLKRILHAYTLLDSPYNTYKYKGLPPGPINFPEIQSIDAVLNAETSDYFYFCAKEDFSGYHNFSKTLDEHLKYARKYQAALNRNKILR
jgi:UPF0755 protein